MRTNKSKVCPSFSKRHSLFTKVFLLILLLVAFEVICYVAFNAALMEKYYVHQKKVILTKAFCEAEKICSDTDADDFAVRLEKLSDDGNLQIMIFSGDDELIFSSMPTNAIRFSDGKEHSAKPRPPREDNFPERETIEKTDSYSIDLSYITELDARSINLSGFFSDGTHVLLRSPMSSIREGVNISNRFMLFSACATSLLATLFGIFLSRRAISSIRKLSEISNRMAELDFSVKYDRRGQGEISVLGQSLNTLSTKLEKAISELKRANLELTRDIDRKEKIDTQRREFLSNVSHELKTPISIIEAYAEGLTEMPLDKDERKFYTEVILDEAKKMETIIQKLMSLMKIESGSEQLMIERYDISEQIEHILEQKQILFEQSGVTAEFSHTDSLWVWADEFLIEEAFLNFLTNAVKYCGGEKQIRVLLTEHDEHVRLSVFNTGSHISDEDAENIWKSFHVLDKARTRDCGGCGLGLSIVAAIAEAHNQKYGVYNADCGIVFWLELDKA